MTCGVLGLPTVCAVQKKLLGETANPLIPVPLRLTVCGLLLALSLTNRIPVCAPQLRGVKLTQIVQLAPAASELPQVLVWENRGLEIAMPDMVTAVVSLLLSVKGTGALLLPTNWGEKMYKYGETVTFIAKLCNGHAKITSRMANLKIKWVFFSTALSPRKKMQAQWDQNQPYF
jgi:hypothetical protein